MNKNDRTPPPTTGRSKGTVDLPQVAQPSIPGTAAGDVPGNAIGAIKGVAVATTISFASLGWMSSAFAAGELTLEAFLTQVQSSHDGFKAAGLAAESGVERSQEADLLITPTLIGGVELRSDSKIPQLPFFTYDRLITNHYQLGISQQTTFGLLAKATYNAGYTSFINPSFSSGSTMAPLMFHEATPMLELTQSLWSNGFGRSTRATLEEHEASSLDVSYQSRFAKSGILVQAESAYWRLVQARRVVQIQKDALDQAQKLKDWNDRRSRMNLVDRVDALQTDAAFQVRTLEYQAATDEERLANRSFNSFRKVSSDQVAERLNSDPEKIAYPEMKIPALQGERDDVRAAREQEKVVSAQATQASERDKPTLDIYGNYAINGRANELSDSLSSSTNSGRPTYAIGLKLSLPLNPGLAKSAQSAWAKQKLSAEASRQQKEFEQEITRQDLVERLGQAQRRLMLSKNLEKIQVSKLQVERERLRNGRTTTFQVLQFEQENYQAQLNVVRAQTELLVLLAQTKLFGEAPFGESP